MEARLHNLERQRRELLHGYYQRHEQMVSNEGGRRHGHVEQVNADKQGQRTFMYSEEATNARVMPTAVSLRSP